MGRQLSQAGGHQRQGAEGESGDRPAHGNKSDVGKLYGRCKATFCGAAAHSLQGLPLSRGHGRRQLITEAPRGLPAMARHRERRAESQRRRITKAGGGAPVGDADGQHRHRKPMG